MNTCEKRVRLRELLAGPDCTPLTGVHDPLGAKIVRSTGPPVLYTGRFVTGASALGLPDVGLAQLRVLLVLPREIAEEPAPPLVCDADTGWFHAANNWRTVHGFESADASAIRIEDTVFGKHTDQTAVTGETEAGANMALYRRSTIFAAFKAVEHVCEAFWKEKGATKLRDRFDESMIDTILPQDRSNNAVEAHNVVKRLR